MARIKFSPVVNSISGSVGSGTFQKNSYGHTLRNKPSRSKSYSFAQVQSQMFVNEIQKAWFNMTDAQRGVWQNFVAYSATFAKHNKNVLLDGHKLFMKYNLIRIHAGFDILENITYAALDFFAIAPEIVSEGPADMSVFFGATINKATESILLKLTAPLKPTVTSAKSKLRVIKMVLTAGDKTFVDISAAYLAIYGIVPDVGETLYMEWTLFSTVAPIMQAPIANSTIVIAP